MFFAVIFIAIGVAILLNTLGFMTGTFWGVFWAVFFIAAGVRIMFKKNNCPICKWGIWRGMFHERMHEHYYDNDRGSDKEPRGQKQ